METARHRYRLRVARLDPGAQLPTKGHTDDLGWDLYALERTRIPARGIARIRTGVAFAFPPGVGGFVKDRSSVASRGLHTLAGVIDPGYRGELLVLVANLTDAPIVVEAGERCAQLVLVHCLEAELEEGELDATTRGAGGFGSTGR